MSSLHRSPQPAGVDDARAAIAGPVPDAEPEPEAAAPLAVPLDGTLLRRACQQDPAAWGILYDHLTPPFQIQAVRLTEKYARRYGSEAHRQLIKDLVQSVWAHIAENCQRLEGKFDPTRGTLKAFLLTVARNQIIDYLRRSGRSWNREVELEEHAEPPGPPRSDPGEQLAERQELAMLKEQLERDLPPQDFQLLWRVRVNDESVEAIAEEERLTRNTLDKRLSRAHERLREWMRKRGLLKKE